jgi:ABC-type amino acid transport substrate-binding protein
MNKRPYLALLLVFSTSIFAATPAHHFIQNNTLNVCSYSEFKPISYGNGRGYEADLLRAIAKSWHVNIQFHPIKTYENIWLLPLSNKSLCDVAIGGITPAPYRHAQGAVFSIGTGTFSQSLLVRESDYQTQRIVSYTSFKHSSMKIGVVPGTTGEVYAHQRARAAGLPATIFKQYASESELLPALLNGDIDAIARGEVGNEYQASLDKNLVTIAKQNFAESFTIALKPTSCQHLRHAMNDAIRKVNKNGKITFKDWMKDHEVFSHSE